MERPLLLRDCLIADGSGRPAFPGEILVRGERIEALGGRLGSPPDGALVLGLGGALAAPGLVDAHSHDDAALLEPGSALPKLAQGVTTVVAGNCGIGFPPLLLPPGGLPPPLDLLPAAAYRFPGAAAYLAALEAARPALNALVLAGHSSLRVARCANWEAPAAPPELAAMRRELEEGLEAGLGGLSAGLAYPTARAAPAAEAAALAAPALRLGLPLALHLRNEYGGMWAALEEALAIWREAGRGLASPGHLVLSHQKCAGPANRGRAGELLRLLEAASGELPLAFDAYPYEAGSTVLEAESAEASRRVLLAWSAPHPELAGLELAEAAGRLGLPRGEAMRALMPAGAVYFHMEEAEVAAILAHPLCMLGSDGLPHDLHPHPRLYGAFARFLGRYVRERRLLPLEEAIRKMTALPARVFGLAGRGLLAPGCFADIAVLRPEAVADRATWEEPRRLAEGVELVLVNGEIAYRAGSPAPLARAGLVLRP